MKSIEIFAGAGGLAAGVARAGFRHTAIIERDRAACETLQRNVDAGVLGRGKWPILQEDIRGIKYSQIATDVDLLSGGPPCQPFSNGGKHQAHLDERDMFPEAVRAVRELKPKAFIFENVKGFTRPSFAAYFNYILLQLQHPNVVGEAGEDWEVHCARLEEFHTSNRRAPAYNVAFHLLNAADYGVPQIRERVFFVGFRSDIGVRWSFPKPTHSNVGLVLAQEQINGYWKEHRLGRKCQADFWKLKSREKTLTQDHDGQGLKRWVTVRDVIHDLPDPEKRHRITILDHAFRDGARVYTGHTGSLLDWPAKALKAGLHGGPGGENMLIKDDGRVRYFTVREAARLQTFPDNFIFGGTWTETIRQLGNAVPISLAETIARSIRLSLSKAKKTGA